MSDHPRISVVTSSFNQGRFIGSTIDSVLAQSYPNLEHIVVDGMSKDNTPEVLARYPHLTVIREPDSGQAEAINKGFRRATGEIFCFLNSDDTFEPGALARVAAEIDPAKGRHVVMGRCRFIDEEGRFIGVEHPSAFESHRRVLEIWKGYTIPQPAVFWTREVWQRSGPLDEREQLVLDYDLFCRFSRDYAFHTFDQIVANYRLHAESKTQGVDDARRLFDSVEVSRRYWPSAWTPAGMAIRLSWRRYQYDRKGRAYRTLQAGKTAWREGRPLATAAHVAGGALLAPDVALAGAAAPLARHASGLARLLVRLSTRPRSRPSPQTEAWRGFTQLHADGWAGPFVELAFERPAGDAACDLQFEAATTPEGLRGPLALTVNVPGVPATQVALGRSGVVATRLPIGHLSPGRHVLTIEANRFLVPHERFGNGDHRPLSFRLLRLQVIAEPSRRAHGK
jgi:glycosyltransferase involved in cell wall biosynthesis